MYGLAHRIRPLYGKLVLIIAGTVFYTCGRLETAYALLSSSALTYLCALLLKKRSLKQLLYVPVIVNIAILFWFKYTGFFLSILGSQTALQILLPVGISFYTFQQIAYLVSVDRKQIEPALLDYLAYILYFPKLLMGPLAEPADLITQFSDPERKAFEAEAFAEGVRLFSYGLLKKVILADTFARAIALINADLSTATAAECLLMMVFYTFEIYYDFSGYSDMALGASKMMNLEIPVNFNRPYRAVNIRDFWKRWHMSLTQFFTKYVYIPLGGSRNGTWKTYRNTMIVFLISGLWHGANWTFLLWGFLHGLLSCFDRMTQTIQDKIPKILRWIVTFIAVSFLWLLFSASSVREWTDLIMKIFRWKDIAIRPEIPEVFRIFGNVLPGTYTAMILFLGSGLVLSILPEHTENRRNGWNMILAAAAFALSVLFLGTESVFLYFGF
ncbi:MAG: hypothetical protein K6A40_02665 [Solobacterium sp.]|nr:hypothetical protein [Solobacterium sp.]